MSGATNGFNMGQCALTGSPHGYCGGGLGWGPDYAARGNDLFNAIGPTSTTSTPGATVTLYVGWAMRYDLGGYVGYGAACINYGTGQNCE